MGMGRPLVRRPGLPALLGERPIGKSGKRATGLEPATFSLEG
jgi:hypothetical protein